MSETQSKQSSFFNQTETEVTVTYKNLGQTEPMKFFTRIFLSKEEKELRQKFFGLTAEEKEAGQHAHNVEVLASVSTKAPENVPEFPVIETTDLKEVQKAITAFFSGDNPMKQKIAADVVGLYFNKTQPAEFFR